MSITRLSLLALLILTCGANTQLVSASDDNGTCGRAERRVRVDKLGDWEKADQPGKTPGLTTNQSNRGRDECGCKQGTSSRSD